MGRPLYKIEVGENDDTGVNFNSLVDRPAHMKDFISFNEVKKIMAFNDEQRTITGVMISVGTPIYRFDEKLGEYDVYFDAETTTVIKRKFMKQGFTQNLNLMHDENNVVIDGAYLTDIFQCSNSDDKLPNFPQAFDSMKLMDGSLLASYRIEDDTLWNDIKNGKFKGFSVEGWFDQVLTNVKKDNKMTKLAKGEFAKISEISKWDIEVDQAMVELNTPLTRTWSWQDGQSETSKLSAGEYTTEDGRRLLVDSDGIVRLIFNLSDMSKQTKLQLLREQIFGKKPDPKKFAEITAVDGTVLSYEGELAVGTQVFITNEAGEQLPAPEGQHEVTLEDGTKKVITLDGSGVITAMEDVSADDNSTDVQMSEVLELIKDINTENEKKFAKLEGDYKEKFEAIEKENKGLKATIELMKKGEKFAGKPLDTSDSAPTTMTARDLYKSIKNK